jgi:hypothetical protein
MNRPVGRRYAWLLLIQGLTAIFGAAESHAASYRTQNFIVTAKRADVARQAAEFAEYYRRAKAIEWLGAEIPAWPTPCTVTVRVTSGEAGGATSFAFDRGRVVGQDMTVEGPLDRILNSVLPHEITHTVFAAKFGRPLPRWADEGGAVLSEDYQELARHDLLVRELINQGRMIPLRRLLVLTEYPDDVMALYAQGFSVANYLVSLADKPRFLDFVWDGQAAGWDRALAAYYGIRSADELEERWIQWLRAGRGTGADRMTLVSSGARSGAEQIVVRGRMADDRAVGRYAAGREWVAQPAASPFDPSIQVASRGAANFAELTPRETIATTRTSAAGHPWLPRPGASPSSAASTTPPRNESEAPADRAASNAEVRPRLIPIAVGRTRRGEDS